MEVAFRQETYYNRKDPKAVQRMYDIKTGWILLENEVFT